MIERRDRGAAGNRLDRRDHCATRRASIAELLSRRTTGRHRPPSRRRRSRLDGRETPRYTSVYGVGP